MTPPIAPAVALTATDLVEEHTFTHPDHVVGDKAVMCMLARDFYGHLQAVDSPTEPVVRFLPTDNNWHRRVMIPNPELVWKHETITVVGFFGRIRDNVHPDVARQIDELGQKLVDAVMTTPGMLGYSTHLLADERNFANLVLLSDPELIERWRGVKHHPKAAEDVSPNYYEYVRIYKGQVGSSEMSDEGAIQLDRVKYWDYRTKPTWHAIRTFN